MTASLLDCLCVWSFKVICLCAGSRGWRKRAAGDLKKDYLKGSVDFRNEMCVEFELRGGVDSLSVLPRFYQVWWEIEMITVFER